MESELDRLRKKVENFPSASLYNRLAELARLNGGVDEAVAACQKCIKEFPRNGQAYVMLAEVALAKGERSEARRQLSTAIDRDPRCYSALRMLADILAEAREPAQAASLLRQILTFRPTDQPVIARIAELEPNAPVAPVAAPVASPVRPAARLATPPPPPRFPTPAPLGRQSVLEPLCRETGVRGALVADGSGQVVVSMNLAAGTEDLLAALAVELAQAGRLAMAQTGCDQAATWAVRADAGQVMLFQRNQFRVVVLADAAIRPAMLELRARQALIDLGAG